MTTPAHATHLGPLTLGTLFRDHAVLQCDRPLPVWGWASPGERITVEFKQQRADATADATGRWQVQLAPEPASTEPARLIVTGRENTLTADDILVGEVWLASGQSNIARPLSDTFQAGAEIAAADYPLVRHFTVAHIPAESPLTVIGGDWQPCSPATVAPFSGVGYFFARDLHRQLGVPVGLIHSSWGGTPIESWLDAATLRATSVYPAIAARWRQNYAEFAERQQRHPAEVEAWKAAEDQALAERGTPNSLPWPRVPIGPGTPYAPSRLYHSMIAPLQPAALRGAIWWQGESNVPRAAEYGELFTALVRSWRAAWGQGDFPFHFVQLSNYHLGCDPTRRQWARLRAAQAEALALPHTGMVPTLDIGDPYEMHLVHKQVAGRRLADLALARTYGQTVPWTGPVFAAAEREGAALRVRFTPGGGDLVLRDGPMDAFELAGADRRFHPAAARIVGDTLLVSRAQVPTPVAVRYAWTNAPTATLFNTVHWPAAPFRSDAWPAEPSA